MNDRDDLVTLLRQALAIAVADDGASAREAGVSAAEWTLLRVLHAAGAVPPSVLAEHAGLTRGAVTKLVDRLRAKRLVVRARGAGDRRFQTIALTGAGASLVAGLAARRIEPFARLTAAERAELAAGLRAAIASARAAS